MMKEELWHNYPKRILLVKNRGMGDAIMAQSTIAYLKSVFPKTHITLLLPSWITPLFAGVETGADAILPLELRSLTGWWNLWHKLWPQKFDLVLELHQTGKTRNFFRLYTIVKNIPYFFHNHNTSGSTFVLDHGVTKPAIQRDLDGVWPVVNIYKKDTAVPSFLDFPPSFQIKHVVQPENEMVFGMVATRYSKMWPLPNYKRLAELILESHPGWKIVIPLSSGKMDRCIEEEWKKLGPPANTSIIHEPLEFLPERLARARFYVGNDTGLKHLAVALGLKTHTFFGPEDPLEWHPYNNNQHTISFFSELPCRREHAHFCGKEYCEDLRCLKLFTPETIFKNLPWF